MDRFGKCIKCTEGRLETFKRERDEEMQEHMHPSIATNIELVAELQEEYRWCAFGPRERAF